MSDLSPYEQLGVSEDASFEEIQEAKQTLRIKYQQNTQVVETIEAAYDAIIMARLRMRQEGKIKVPDQIRFPSNTTTKNTNFFKEKSSEINGKTSMWLQNLIDNPSPKEVTINGIIFLCLAIITVFAQSNDMLPFLLTLGVATSFYFLYQKQRLFWRAAGLTFVAFVIGILLGSIFASAIFSSGLPLSINNEQFAALFTLFFFWLVSNFFR